MARLSNSKINKLLETGLSGRNTTEQGRALEDLICYIFEKIPGISLSARNEYNVLHTQEIDVAFWNDKPSRGLSFLPNIIPVECKNWTRRVGGPEISWFVQKLKDRGRSMGVFIARSGITGNPSGRIGAEDVIISALKDRIEVIIISGDELKNLKDTEQLITLFKGKLCELAITTRAF